MEKDVNKIVEHIIEVGKQDIYTKTYEEGIDKGARLMLAYLIKNRCLNKEFLDIIFDR